MKIGFDIDEVLADFLVKIIDFHNRKYGSFLKKDDFISYNLWEVWGGTKEQAIKKVFDFYQSPEFFEIPTVCGSKDAVNFLKNGNELFVITSRSMEISDITQKWIESNFKDMFSEIFFANSDYHSQALGKTKKEICDQVGIDLMIEDSFKFASECVTEKRKVVLLDYPWNRSQIKVEGIKRASDWNSALEIINKRLN